ncbi:MAG: serine/threonine-protein phosphatase [Deltaproteobacteria bacterium]|jgi:protein phosphatase|nr:serine/threonine-protein phosphatase [Deltaproteobacteria bacterium]
MTKTAGSGATRGGEVFRNEDAFLVEDELGLYAVCDGWGQHPGGEVASFVVIEAIEQCLEADPDLARGQLPAAEQVEDAVRFALNAVNEIGQERADLEGMATTVTLLIVRGRRGLIAHTGDSRAYLLRRGKALQLTSDQEWHDLSEGGAPPRQAPAFTIEVFPVQLSPGDTIVLCTDGAEKELEDSDQIQAAHSLPPRILASRLVAAAHRREPHNDATVVVVRIREPFERAHMELSHPPRRTAFGHVLPLPPDEDDSSSDYGERDIRRPRR